MRAPTAPAPSSPAASTAGRRSSTPAATAGRSAGSTSPDRPPKEATISIHRAFVQQHPAGPSVEARAALEALDAAGVPADIVPRADLLLGRAAVSRRTLVVGDLDVVGALLRRLGARPPFLPTYPPEVHDLLRRRVRRTTLGAARADVDDYGDPRFIKPVEAPTFAGFVYRGRDDAASFCGAPSSTPVWSAEPVAFVREQRAYVARGRIVGITPYRGRPAPSAEALAAEALERLGGAAPAGFAIDVGTLADGRDALVEVNDGFGLGLYPGLPASAYLDVLIARWTELLED